MYKNDRYSHEEHVLNVNNCYEGKSLLKWQTF